MALSIKDPEADKLARALSKRTGETLTEAVVIALRERLARTVRAQQTSRRAEDIRAIIERFHALPVQDPRSPDEILGYDEHGLPR